MDLHDTMVDLSFYVSRTYFSISTQSDVAIQSYWPAKLGTEFGY